MVYSVNTNSSSVLVENQQVEKYWEYRYLTAKKALDWFFTFQNATNQFKEEFQKLQLDFQASQCDSKKLETVALGAETLSKKGLEFFKDVKVANPQN